MSEYAHDFLARLSLETLIVVLDALRDDRTEHYHTPADHIDEWEDRDMELTDYILLIKENISFRGMRPTPMPKRHYKLVLAEHAAANNNLAPIGFLDWARGRRLRQWDDAGYTK